MQPSKNREELEFRQFSENFTFYVVEYASVIENLFNEIILVDLVRDRRNYKDYLKYYQNQTFNNKKNLVKIIIESNYSNYLDTFSEIFTRITNVQKWRNDLAHHSKHYLHDSNQNYTFVLANSIIGEEICLIKEKMQTLLSEFEKTVSEFRELTKIIRKDRRYNLDC